MLKLLITSALVLCFVKSDCLTNDNLTKLGLTPLETPQQLANPSICREVLTTSKICVDEQSLKKAMEEFQDKVNKQRRDKYNKLENKVKELAQKMEKFNNKVKGEGYKKNGKEISQQARNAMVENEEFVPEGANILEAEIEDMASECIQAQNQITFGVFCLMASDQAS